MFGVIDETAATTSGAGLAIAVLLGGLGILTPALLYVLAGDLRVAMVFDADDCAGSCRFRVAGLTAYRALDDVMAATL